MSCPRTVRRMMRRESDGGLRVDQGADQPGRRVQRLGPVDRQFGIVGLVGTGHRQALGRSRSEAVAQLVGWAMMEYVGQAITELPGGGDRSRQRTPRRQGALDADSIQ